MLRGFRDFILRGNVVDLAVAVVIGAAFGTIVSALTKDFITPIIAAVGGKPDFGSLSFTVNSSTFAYGDFINALVSFVIVAAAVYFLVVLPINKVMTLRAKPAEGVTTRDCPECLSSIPVAARRCSFCTSAVTPAG
ncbi:MAG TPA: large conductance mechanosensitive channel protein MscL [Candidatus Dormibacteraeota bacterium]|nr:large conductance mechanosensitive channel protein MscL [Candidatus Dormibacteraeota bacterium]